MTKTITILQAYKAMYGFLRDLYYREGQPDNIGGFLSDLQILDNGTTLDPASWHDWIKKVEEVINQENDDKELKM